MITAFRVRRKTDGLFSMGSSNPKFSKAGKFFTNSTALHNHIRWFLKGPAWLDSYGSLQQPGQDKPNPKDYEIVTYVAHEIDTHPLVDAISVPSPTGKNWG